MKKNTLVVLLLFFSALCSESAAAIGVREMISEMIDIDKTPAPLILNITKDKIGEKFEFFLDVEIVNHQKVALCIPANLFHSRSMTLLPDILSVSDSQGKPFPPLNSHQWVTWPIDRYVIIPKGSKNIATIALSELFDLSTIKSELEVSLTVLSFDCTAVLKGYPITNMFSEDSGFFSKLGPKRTIRQNEIHVFRGAIKGKFEDTSTIRE